MADNALKRRLVTALVLVPLVVAGVLLLPNPLFALMLALFVAAAAWEWTALGGLVSRVHRGLFVAAVCLSLPGAFVLPAVPLLALGLVWWLVALGWLVAYTRDATVLANAAAAKALAGILVLVPAWKALVATHAVHDGPFHVLFLLVLVWVADSGAYFAGRRFGVTKLAPKISPGKTWAGVCGALLASALCAALGGWLLEAREARLALFVVLCLVVVGFSIVGDLFESMLKRQAGIKDSGTLLPGHGGVLDRIDSLVAASPVFLAGLLLLG